MVSDLTWLYKAVPSNKVGITEDGTVVVGLELVLEKGPDPEIEPGVHPNWLSEEVAQVGSDILLGIPDGGLVAGGVYALVMYDVSTDWETGHVDDYKMRLVKVEATDARCRSGRDGDCTWEGCPQNRDGEPAATGRSCPLYDWEATDAR